MSHEKEMGKTRFSVSYVSKASLSSLTTFVFIKDIDLKSPLNELKLKKQKIENIDKKIHLTIF